ncbi:helicase associated domain-containing protein [Arthrobacter globiformis]|uniref:helicase associated domain-containing protein n=1 Tax=Arthrobacter globiformis TaxID=1665 RepID=UPI0027D839FD|nr:helicase associated domain-containing protein [Arthrobacter globiformis]
MTVVILVTLGTFGFSAVAIDVASVATVGVGVGVGVATAAVVVAGAAAEEVPGEAEPVDWVEGAEQPARSTAEPRAEADEARWQGRLTALIAYRAAGHDWPRHKATITGEEHELGVWLHTQRFKQRRGELELGRADALDAGVPGWRAGRPRGRQPLGRS